MGYKFSDYFVNVIFMNINNRIIVQVVNFLISLTGGKVIILN